MVKNKDFGEKQFKGVKQMLTGKIKREHQQLIPK
jgi:hypothetical protein